MVHFDFTFFCFCSPSHCGVLCVPCLTLPKRPFLHWMPWTLTPVRGNKPLSRHAVATESWSNSGPRGAVIFTVFIWFNNTINLQLPKYFVTKKNIYIQITFDDMYNFITNFQYSFFFFYAFIFCLTIYRRWVFFENKNNKYTFKSGSFDQCTSTCNCSSLIINFILQFIFYIYIYIF